MITSPNWIRYKNRGRRRNAEFHKQRGNPTGLILGILMGVALVIIGLLIL